MRTVAATSTRPLALPKRSTSTALMVLGRREARRILRSPVFVGIVVIFVALGGLSVDLTSSLSWPSRSELYEGIGFVLLL